MNTNFRNIKSGYMTRNVIITILLLVSVSGFAQVQTQVIGDSVIVKSINGFVVKTNETQRLSVWADGTVNIAPNDSTRAPLFRVYPNGDFSAGTTNRYDSAQNYGRNGLRFHKKLGL